MTNRLETFRGYMARLDAAANPARAVERGFYVDRPGRTPAREMAARLELRPSSAHLLVGGIGSGKTTQLLIARDQLNQLSDIRAIYLDVSERQDIGKMKPGALVALAGLALSEALDAQANKAAIGAAEAFKSWAHGYWTEPSWSLEDEGLVRVDGVLSPPGGSLPPEVEEKVGALTELRNAIAERTPHQVLLLDSLDRLWDPIAFERLVEQEVRAIRSTGIGVVLAGPLRAMYGLDRPLADRFDYFYYQSPVDARENAEGPTFLTSVLRARLPAEVLPDEPCLRLATWSGGVLRDLISLARAAFEEAYLQGAEQIANSHVDAAADAFGRTHMLGLGPDEIEILQRVRFTGTFVQTSDKDLALLVTRRVLEYRSVGTRYAVHPTIQPLLIQLAAKR